MQSGTISFNNTYNRGTICHNFDPFSNNHATLGLYNDDLNCDTLKYAPQIYN